MAKAKIAVIGGNQTGLACALFCAEEGFDVTVFEAKQPDEVAYDWTDDVETRVFDEVDLPHPPQDVWFRKRNWTFVPPNKSCHATLELPEEEQDYSVLRRPFNAWLEKLAVDAGAVIKYGTAVDKLDLDGLKITGVTLADGQSLPFDLVVDCSGADSVFRDSLPDEIGIPKGYDPYDTFLVRRSFFNRPEGSEDPEFKNKAYFLHLAQKGISWVILSHDEKQADVLIGRLAQLPDEEHQAALDDLREDNPIIGTELMTGGQLCRIPVRRPISKMFADGYVLMGDSAFMTIPLMGSGIAAGLRAAKYLSSVLANPVGKPFLSRNLYRYQMLYMHKVGANHAGIDIMKRWILQTDPKNIDFLFSSGTLDNALLESGATGAALALTLPQILVVGLKGRRRPLLLTELATILRKLKRVTAIAEDMPLVYIKSTFEKWQKEYEQAFPVTETPTEDPADDGEAPETNE